ncbi:thioredoxin fold domain-containing protein [Acidithiobacillus montserratensis]|uniref:Thioredoxin fold domain-containing protein n=1 Tax=Acidithiobacillus montserratensis TaxID=2729135 RepID=A0ACD5HI21_9PROT|nr:thioredoxin fold domain-containing protein [Acidithiobacillus montserratensis]MBN2680663.1 thioredoxin fold domain-containing protein [Acidithiobacillaceae bacterium]MBU2746707.1 thioredoxin fold domain-containing protein [Acidithiobacillus montserratensis]
MKNGMVTLVLKWLIIGSYGGGLLLAGTSLAEAQTVHSPPQKKLTPGILWNQILAKHISYIQEGHQGPIIYDFQDPNCPYCHVMYEHEAPLIKAGKLTVRYVPVAFLTPQSPAEAASWLQSAHPLATLEHFETIVGPALRSGNYHSLPKVAPNAKTTQELNRNLAMMSALGFEGTPAILYRVKNGQLGRIPGMISQQQLSRLLPHLRVAHG